jgi:hypothetical protein
MAIPSTRIPSPVYRKPKSEKTTFAELTTQLEDAGTKAADQLNGLPFANGTVVKGISFTFGADTTVQHGLGRAWSGYWFVRKYSAGSGVPEANDNGYFGDTRDSSYISLHAAGTFIGDIFIY